MKKNGFTLIELLAVITIILLIMALILPNFVKMQKSTKEDLYNSKVKLIESAAKEFAMDNLDDMVKPCGNNEKCFNSEIKVINLLEEEYLKSDEKNTEIFFNPTNNKIMNNCNIDVKYDGLGIKANYVKNRECEVKK